MKELYSPRSSYLYQIAHLGDDDEEPEFSSAMPLEEGETFFFAPRPLKNLVLVDELESLSPIMSSHVSRGGGHRERVSWGSQRACQLGGVLALFSFILTLSTSVKCIHVLLTTALEREIFLLIWSCIYMVLCICSCHQMF